jgi:hypothetical protein
LLRFNKYGKHALSDEQKLNSNLFLLLLTIATVSFTLTLSLKIDLSPITIVSLGLLFPVIGTFRQGNKKNKKKSMIFMSVLIVAGALFILSEFTALGLTNLFFQAFLFGVIGYTWFINTLKN